MKRTKMKNQRVQDYKDGSVVISTSVSKDLHTRARKAGIRWSIAIRKGIMILLEGEKMQTIIEEQNRKIGRFSELLFDANKRISELEDEYESIKGKKDSS